MYQYLMKNHNIALIAGQVGIQHLWLFLGNLPLDCWLPDKKFPVNLNKQERQKNRNQQKFFSGINLGILQVQQKRKLIKFTSLISLLAPLYWLISWSIIWPFFRTLSTSRNISFSDSVGWASAIKQLTSQLVKKNKKKLAKHTHFQNPETNRSVVEKNTFLLHGLRGEEDYPLFR